VDHLRAVFNFQCTHNCLGSGKTQPGCEGWDWSRCWSSRYPCARIRISV
jgi:hypothetical protein